MNCSTNGFSNYKEKGGASAQPSDGQPPQSEGKAGMGLKDWISKPADADKESNRNSAACCGVDNSAAVAAAADAGGQAQPCACSGGDKGETQDSATNADTPVASSSSPTSSSSSSSSSPRSSVATDSTTGSEEVPVETEGGS